jgi:preprotein translocase subunit SecY
VGAGFLALVAITPTIISNLMKIDPTLAQFFGGPGLLIVVSVASTSCRRSTATW